MTWEPRPLPEVTPESAEYWSAAADGRLLLGRCRACGLEFHPPRQLCPDCFAETDAFAASNNGRVYAYTVLRVHREWPEEHMPVLLAYVELEEGPRAMFGVPAAKPDDVMVGADVTVRFEPTELEDVGIPVVDID